ncbi:MAG: hypothetical protein KGL39_51165 [Patescibacteria group bacterium]|nr:hypothetical protein [Patescibacteria group bacterium]
MMLAPFFAYFARIRAERAIRIAERKRSVIMAQIASRKASHKEWKPLAGLLRDATTASLRAYAMGKRMEPR